MRPAKKPDKYKLRLSRLLEAGKFEDAQQLAIRLSRTCTRDTDIWYTLAGLYARQGRIDQVISCCERVILINPNHGGAHYNLATALRQTGQLNKAESSFRKCLTIDAGNAPALLGLGKLLSSEGRQTEALPYFKKSTQAQPPNAEAFYCLGVAQQSQGDLDKAMDTYKRAARIRPDYFEAINNLGHILSEQGNFDQALELFNKLTTLKPDSAEIYNNTGVVYESMGKIEEAEAAYRKAISLNPSLSETRSHLGFLLADEGRTPEALEYFKSALDSDPGHEPAIAGQAVAMEKLGRIEDAHAAIEPAISAGSDNPDIVLAYCKIMLRKGKPRAGIHLAEQLLANGHIPPKGIADLNFALGDLYGKTDDHSAAFSHYKKANDASPCTYNHQSHVRYIDRIINTTSKETLHRLPRATQAPKQMVFIIGMPRSGSSLIEQILSSHPDVFGAGELRYIGDIANSLSPNEQSGTRYPDAIEKLDQADINRMAQRYIESVARVSDGSHVVTDKMPHNFLYLGLIPLLLPTAKIIHVSRTPLDNCLSLYFHSFNPMHSYTTDLQILGKYYREYQRLMDHWRDVINIPFLDIRYEDIVGNQEQSTRDILEFCGLDWSDECLNFHNSGRFVKTPSYDQVRRPVYTSSVDRWKHYRPFIAPLQAALGTQEQQYK